MNAVEALRLAKENGVRIGVLGSDLFLEADHEPAPVVLEAMSMSARNLRSSASTIAWPTR